MRNSFLLRLLIFIIFAFLSTAILAEAKLTIHISGITGNALKNTQARLAVAEENSVNDIDEFYHDVPEHIKKALAPYGYFKVNVQTKRSNHSLYFHVEPGPLTKIAHIDLEVTGPGKEDPVIQQFVQHFPLQQGKTLLTEEYEKAKDALFQTALNQGYLKAFLQKKAIEIDLTHDTANIILHLNTGERYYFGRTGFGASPFASEFLNRFVSFKEGEPFSSEKLLQFQNNLSSSGYFKNVIVTPEFENAENNQIPTQVAMTVPKSQQYKIGLGYGTFTGPRLTMGMDWRRIADAGQHLAAELKLSSVLSGLSAKYFIPGNNPLTDQYIVGLNVQHFVPENGDSFSETLSAGYLKTLEKWHHSLTLNFLNDRYSENNLPIHSSHLLYPSYTLSRISADNMINPHHGTSMSLTVQGASETFASTTSFFQSEWKGKYIFSPSAMSKVILASHFGYTVVNDLEDLPLTMNFFAGGLNSIRGYHYDSLGPGRYLKTASVEFQHKIIGDWSGAVFYDFGNVGNHFNDPIKVGDGLGLIYSSAVGPVKLYVGRAESEKTKPLNIEFSIGPEF